MKGACKTVGMTPQNEGSYLSYLKKGLNTLPRREVQQQRRAKKGEAADHSGTNRNQWQFWN